MLGGFFGKVTNYSLKRWRAEVFYNGIEKPIFCIYCQGFTKKEAEKHLFNEFIKYLQEHKNEIAEKIENLRKEKQL